MNDRQNAILTCLVDHFIDACQPISSSMVQERLEIQISSASIRQVFSVLDQNGYIEKLHTSSGRVPTDKGYRAYVDRFEMPNSLTLDAHVNYETYYDKFRFLFEQFLNRLAQRIPYITILKLNHQELKDLVSIQYVSLSSSHGLLILFHRVGVVSKIQVSFGFDISGLNHQNLIGWIQKNLKRKVSDDELFQTFNRDDVHYIKSIRSAILNQGHESRCLQNLFIKNTRQCLSLNDYQTKESVEKLLDILENVDQVSDLMSRALNSESFTISIGHELNDERLVDSSLIGIPIILDGVVIASIAILGPIRMDYSKIIQFFSSNQTLAELIQF